jgi:drug/metabolite transporter (DMT)-like permease
VPLAGLAAALAASCLFSLGSALQALDAREAPQRESLRLALLARLARRRRWIAGLVLGGLGFPLQVLALAHAPFVVVQPALAGGLVLLLVISARLLDERIGAGEALGVASIGLGIGLLAWGAPGHSEVVRGQASSISVLAGLAALSLVPFALRGRRYDLAIVVMVGSALGFAATNIATKLVTDDLAGGHYLAVGVWIGVAAALGVGATITEMTALQRRRATTVIPISFALQTFFPVAIEPLYLREHWSTAALAGVPLCAGMALVLAGGLALTRARGVGELVAGG